MVDSNADLRICLALWAFNRSILSVRRQILSSGDVSPERSHEALVCLADPFRKPYHTMDIGPLPVRVSRLRADYQARIRDVLGGSHNQLFSLAKGPKNVHV
jgi:hypothetical protein